MDSLKVSSVVNAKNRPLRGAPSARAFGTAQGSVKSVTGPTTKRPATKKQRNSRSRSRGKKRESKW